MKHANPTIWPTAEKQEPAHSKGWSLFSMYNDGAGYTYTPGKHAKPFGKHHPATPVTVAPRKKWLKARTSVHIECRICNMKDVAA